MATDKAKRITTKRFWEALVAAGVFRDDEYIARIVIDAQVGNAVVMYVQRYGDERLLQVAQTLEGIEIRGVPAEPVTTDRHTIRVGPAVD